MEFLKKQFKNNILDGDQENEIQLFCYTIINTPGSVCTLINIL